MKESITITDYGCCFYEEVGGNTYRFKIRVQSMQPADSIFKDTITWVHCILVLFLSFRYPTMKL